MALEQLVDVLTAQGKVGDDALKMTRQIAIATSRHFGDMHTRSIKAMGSYGQLLALNQKKAAVPTLCIAAARAKKVMGECRSTRNARFLVAQAVAAQGRAAQESPLRPSRLTLTAPVTVSIRAAPAAPSTWRADPHPPSPPAQAEPLFGRCVADARAAAQCPGSCRECHADLRKALSDHADILMELGRYPAAEAVLREAVNESCCQLGEEHSDTCEAVQRLAEALQAQDNMPQALLIMESLFGPADPRVRRMRARARRGAARRALRAPPLM